MPLHIKHHVQLMWPRARFLSLAGSKLRLCSANHRAGYFSNLACDWLSIVWAYSEQETENRPRTNQSFHCIKLPGPWDTNNEQSMIEKNIFQNISKGQPRSELWHNIRLDGPEDPPPPKKTPGSPPPPPPPKKKKKKNLQVSAVTLQYLWPRPPGVWLGGPGCKPGHSGWS